MLIVALALAASTQATAPDPYTILSGARTYWQAQRYPATVDYTIHAQALRNGDKLDERHYNARWFASDGTISIHPLSWEQEAHPYVPGTGFNFGPLSIGAPHDGGGIKDDLLGLPMLAPNYSFAIAPYVPPVRLTTAEIVERIRAEYHDPSPAKIAALERLDGPRVIATVTSSAKHDYTVTLVGTEPYADHSDYHLRLEPLRDPGRFRLRELWIDTLTYATDRLVNQGNFLGGPAAGVPWSVTFADVGGARYISSEDALQSFKTGFHQSMADYRVSFESIAPGVGRFWPGMPDGAQLFEPQ